MVFRVNKELKNDKTCIWIFNTVLPVFISSFVLYNSILFIINLRNGNNNNESKVLKKGGSCHDSSECIANK